jgi:two-component system cell cycle response regulator
MESTPSDKKLDPDTGGDPMPADEPTTVVGLRAPVLPAAAAGLGTLHPHLVVLAGESVGRTFRIEREETTIGRSEDSPVRLHDEGVSRRHARILRIGNDVWLEDLESANGTRVNGDAIVRQRLYDGDKIDVGGRTVLRFAHSDALEEGFHQAMYEAAVRDGLTRVYNKRHFLERLTIEVAFAQRHRTELSLLMLDVDHFKKINDGYGHPGGDCVLTVLAKLLTGTVRTEDLVARYGGEEFGVLCRGTALDQAARLAERLRRTVESHAFVYEGQRIAVTISIGASACTDPSHGAERLLSDADAALYRAKRAGRNRVASSGAPGEGEA